MGFDTGGGGDNGGGGGSDAKYLGVFIDEAALNLAHPSAVNGSTATVTNPNGNLFYYSGGWIDTGTGYLGDMLKAVYDPTAKNNDSFSMGYMDETSNAKVFTDVERAKLAELVPVTYAVNQSTHGFSAGQPVYNNGGTWELAQADTLAKSSGVGFIISVDGVDDFTIQYSGVLGGLGGLTPGEVCYLDPDNAGQITATKPQKGFTRLVYTAINATTIFLHDSRTVSSTVVGSDGTIYSPDSTRSNKLLSQATSFLQFGKNNSLGNEYIRFGGDAREGNSGIVFAWPVTIVGFTLQGSNVVSQDYEIEVNGVLSALIQVTAGAIALDNLNIDVPSGQRINIFATDSPDEIDDVYGVLLVKRRFS